MNYQDFGFEKQNRATEAAIEMANTLQHRLAIVRVEGDSKFYIRVVGDSLNRAIEAGSVTHVDTIMNRG